MALTNSYVLRTSPEISMNGHEEEMANLTLAAAPPVETGTIVGAVTLNGAPAPNAIVQLLNTNNQVVEHTTTTSAGRFNFSLVPMGSYFLVAAGTGYLTSTRVSVTVTRITVTVNLTMQPDPNASRNAIFGTVVNSVNQPVPDAAVELVKLNGTEETVVGLVSTNQEGKFLFGELEDGEYFIRVSKPGFLAAQSASVTVANRQFVPLNVVMSVNPAANTGTVSGFITDASTGQPISRALVVLYRVNGGPDLVVNVTRTNLGGYYVFGAVEPGTYRVGATVQVTV